MNSFLKKIVERNRTSPSEVCLQAFNTKFEDAIHVEWFNKKDHHEAIFYKNNLEHIALFSLLGELKEYRQNLSSDYLPEAIKNKASAKGEIMNIVLKNKGNLLEYELILRDENKKRFLLVLSESGNIIEERKL